VVEGEKGSLVLPYQKGRGERGVKAALAWRGRGKKIVGKGGGLFWEGEKKRFHLSIRGENPGDLDILCVDGEREGRFMAKLNETGGEREVGETLHHFVGKEGKLLKPGKRRDRGVQRKRNKERNPDICWTEEKGRGGKPSQRVKRRRTEKKKGGVVRLFQKGKRGRYTAERGRENVRKGEVSFVEEGGYLSLSLGEEKKRKGRSVGNRII